MKLNTFGKTGMLVSEVGFGGSRIGGVFADRKSRREAARVLHLSLDAGINFYDTADIYSQGESESLIGAAFRDRRSKVLLATKGGYCLPARRNLIRMVKPLVRPLVKALGLKRARMPAGMSGALSKDFSPAYLANALEASLKRLHTDHVDLYQLHSPSVEFMQSDAFGESLLALERLKTQGKLRFFGVGTETPEEAAACVSAPGISSVQLGFGLLDLESLDQGTLAKAAERGIAVIARGCFAGGLLKPHLNESQLREAAPKLHRIEAVRAYSNGIGRDLLEVAFQFCRGTPGVSVTLLGMRTQDHLRDNLRHVQASMLEPHQYQGLMAASGT